MRPLGARTLPAFPIVHGFTGRLIDNSYPYLSNKYWPVAQIVGKFRFWLCFALQNPLDEWQDVGGGAE